MSIPFSAGALYSTTEDLLRWEQGLFGGKVLKPESLAKMTTPFKQDYAFGLGVSSNNGHKMIAHDGGIEGFNTSLATYPGRQAGGGGAGEPERAICGANRTKSGESGTRRKGGAAD
jgi:Beta-lactamase.